MVGGAIDIVMIEDEQQTIKSTSWHAQFALTNDLTQDSEVTIEINEQQIPISTYLDESGFVWYAENENSLIVTEQTDSDNVQSLMELEEDSEEKEELLETLNLFDKIRMPTKIQLHALRPFIVKGENKVVFKAKHKITQKVFVQTCSLFFWDKNSKIVISDIDGTITKSDVRGHIYEMMNSSNWIQPGLCSLYQSYEKKQYKLVYLSSRPLSRSGSTKSFLRKNSFPM